MVIMASTLQKAINEARHITPEEIARDNMRAVPDGQPGRLYAYRVTLYMYSGRIECHYVEAENKQSAHDKGYKWANPIANSGVDGVRWMDAVRLSRKYCQEKNITFE